MAKVVQVGWLLAILILSLPAAAEKPKQESARVVDSGTFVILVNGRQVATETFKMEQSGSLNTVSSELRFGAGNGEATQTSELQVLPTGELKRYVWREVLPLRAQIVVEPQDANFLVEHITSAPDEPVRDVTHPLSPHTSILDDNFFSHLQVLAWKYMALNCRPDANGRMECRLKPERLPVLVPHQQQSMLVVMEFAGQQKVQKQGVEAEMLAFKLKTEAGDWDLWMDGNRKLIRILIPGEQMEVIRSN